MKILKLFVPCFLAFILFGSFATKHVVQQPTFCGPHVYVNNQGAYAVSDIDIFNGDYSNQYYNISTGTNYYTGQWSIGTGVFEIKIILAGGQNGSIKVFKGPNVLVCQPTISGEQSYRFEFYPNDCGVYTIYISSDPC